MFTVFFKFVDSLVILITYHRQYLIYILQFVVLIKILHKEIDFPTLEIHTWIQGFRSGEIRINNHILFFYLQSFDYH